MTKRMTYADVRNEIGYLYNFDDLSTNPKTPKQLLAAGFDTQGDFNDLMHTISQNGDDSDIAYWCARVIGGLERIMATLDQESVNDALRVARKMHELYYKED